MTHTDDLLEPHETELRDLLERTMSSAPAPSEIGPHALRHGRRLRTRRRVGLVAGAVAATAAAALILPAALGGGSTRVIDPAGPPTTSATAPPNETATSQASPEPAVPPDDWWNMPAVDMVSTVEAILPDGVTMTSPGPLEAITTQGLSETGWIAPVLSGESGPGMLNVALTPDFAEAAVDDAAQAEAQATGEPSPAGEYTGPDGWIDCPGNVGAGDQCTEIIDDNGEHVGRRSVTTNKDLVTFELTLRRDGGAISIAAFNSISAFNSDGQIQPGHPQASSDAPPLTLDQLEDLVRNDAWVKPAT